MGGGKKSGLRHIWSSHDADRHLHNGLCHIYRPWGRSVSSGSNFKSPLPNHHP